MGGGRVWVASLGLNLKFPSDVFNSCQISTRRLLSSSLDPNIKRLYTLSKNQNNIIHDETVETAGPGDNHIVKAKCNKIQQQKVEESTWKEFLELKKQSLIIKSITEFLPSQRIFSWQKIVDKMPSNIFSFCRRAIILALPTKANLKSWNLSTTNTCTLCNQNPQTQFHVLNNCSRAVEDLAS